MAGSNIHTAGCSSQEGEAKVQVGGQRHQDGHFLREVSAFWGAASQNCAILTKSRIFRKTQAVTAPIPSEYQTYLRQVNNWNFNSFELDEVTNGHALKYVGFELFNRYGFLERFKVRNNLTAQKSMLKKFR